MDGVKFCPKCREIKDVNNFYADRTRKGGRGGYCKTCDRKDYPSSYYKYGIQPKDYRFLMKKQSGCCAICYSFDVRKLSIDHDHKTGRVRGLLCSLCNVGLGHFKNNPLYLLEAVKYLAKS